MFSMSLCILLCAWGHLFRDGWPATGSTQLARLIAGLLCFAGALAVHPLILAAIVGIAIFVGFYTDQQHAAGMGAATWKDTAFLTLSGLTSLVPLALGIGLYTGAWTSALMLLAGLLKPAIWFFWWRIRPDHLWVWLEPTRVSAITFGAVVGAVAAVA